MPRPVLSPLQPAVSAKVGRTADSDPITEYLMSGEQLLFTGETAEIKEHESGALKFGRSLEVGLARAAGNKPTTRRPMVKWGPIAITDRRIYVATTQGVFSKRLVIEFEAIYDPEYAKQRIEYVRASNLKILEQAKSVNIFSREKFKTEHGYQYYVDILTAASLQKGTLAGEYLFLKVYRVYVAEDVLKRMRFQAKLFGDKYIVRINEAPWEVRFKRPLSIATSAMLLGLTVAPGAQWFVPILLHYRGKVNISYEPILDILQAKAEELSGLVKELEAGAA